MAWPRGNPAVAAQFYIANVGSAVSKGIELELGTRAAPGVDLFTGGSERWGLGVGWEADGYGMGGLGGNLGWWSTQGRYALGFVTGRVADHDRCERVENALRSCLGLPPL